MKKLLQKSPIENIATAKSDNKSALNIETLRIRLAEAEDTLTAIRTGQVDALVVHTPEGDQIFTLKGIDYSYRMIVEQMNEGTITVSEQGVILYSNYQFAKLVALPLQQVIGSSLSTYINDKDYAKILKYLNQKIKTTYSGELTINANNGSSTPCLISLSSLQKFGTPTFCLVITDLTVQKQAKKLRKALAELEVIFHNITDAVTVIDAKRKIIYANQKTAELVGVSTPEETINVPVAKLMKRLDLFDINGNPFPWKNLPALQALQGQNNLEETYQLKNKATGQTRWINLKGVPIFDQDGKIRFVVTVTRDITKQREIEQRKDDFISMASHELKTPLTSTKIFTQILLNEFKSSPRASKLLKKMNAQTDKLNTLVSEMLDATRIQQGKLALNSKVFVFKPAALEIIEELQDITNHKLIVKWRTNEKVYADIERVRQVFTNFVTNAMKYSPDDKDIIIQSQKKDGFIIVSVQDFGIGIPKEEQKYVFDRFYQVHKNNGNTYPGLGLGLYISKEIISRMGGKMWVESEEGKGSTFYFTLPIAKNV